MIYLDNCATTRVFDSGIDIMNQYMSQQYINCSAPYAEALINDKHFHSCKKELAKTINAEPDEIYFTSGGTESDNTAIFGSVTKDRNKIIISAIEHPAIYQAANRCKQLGCEIITLPVDINGIVDEEYLKQVLDEKSAVVSIMHVNNETGTINPIEKFAKITHEIAPNCVFHSDGVQAHMRVACDVKKSGIDAYSMSGHKIHAPKGIGAIYISKKKNISSFIYGGGQQNGFRSGTINLPSIAAYSHACSLMDQTVVERISKIKHIFMNNLQNCKFNASGCETAPHILSVAFAGVQASTLQNALEGSGVIVGKGSACSSRNAKLSHVLESMNIPKKEAEGTIRIGIGAYNTEEEASIACDIINRVSSGLMRFVRK